MLPAGLDRNAGAGRPVLIVLHQEHSTPGRIGQLLRQRGLALDIRRPRYGEPLPETLQDHAGAVIFGGPQSANDSDGFIRQEIDWIGVPLKEGKPYLGVCLGAQMLARHCGTRVYPHPQGQAEVGYYPVRPTDAGLEVCSPWPAQVYQWHREGFDLPSGAELLAQGDAFPVQAFRLGRAVALQFHMDVTHAMMCRWTTRGHDRMSMPNAQARDAHFQGRLRYDAACQAWLSGFLDHWLPPASKPATAGAQDRGGSSVSIR